MSLRTDLIPVVDAGRTLVSDLGFRQHIVTIRVRDWSGRIGAPGGTYTDTDTVLAPRPKVSEPPARMVFDAPGRYEAGDLYVTKVSRTYTEAQLSPPPASSVEVLYIVSDIDGTDREYKLVGAPSMLSFGWRLHLRRRNRAAS